MVKHALEGGGLSLAFVTCPWCTHHRETVLCGHVAKCGAQRMTPPGLSSHGDLPLWVAGVWHQMGRRAETAQDRWGGGRRLLQSSSYLAPHHAAPWCLRVYRPALPCLGLRDLRKADCSGGLPSSSVGPGARSTFSAAAPLPPLPAGMQSPHLARCCTHHVPSRQVRLFLHFFLEIWCNS